MARSELARQLEATRDQRVINLPAPDYDADAQRFMRRLERLQRDVLETPDDPKGTPYGLATALYRRAPDA